MTSPVAPSLPPEAYAAALNLIPEVAASYAYFVGRDKDAEAARQARLAQTLDRAEAAFSSGNLPAAAASLTAARRSSSPTSSASAPPWPPRRRVTIPSLRIRSKEQPVQQGSPREALSRLLGPSQEGA